MWYFLYGISPSYERLLAQPFCASLIPILKKLYPKKEEFILALKRHLIFYNTELTAGSCINGVVIAMEEQKSLSNEGSEDDSMIVNIKTGLMGPLAGIGDALIWAGLMPMIIAMFLPLANKGNILGAILPIVAWTGITAFIGYTGFMNGYTVGRKSIMRLFQSGKIKELIEASSVLGLFMMGALAASYIKISTPMSFSVENASPIVLQNVLNSIVPGLLEFATVFGIYFYIKSRGPKYLSIIMFILAICMISSYFGIL